MKYNYEENLQKINNICMHAYIGQKYNGKLKISKNILSIYQSQTREFFRAREKKKKNLSIVENDSAHTHLNRKYTKSPIFKFQTVQISKRKQTWFYRGRKYGNSYTRENPCARNPSLNYHTA